MSEEQRLKAQTVMPPGTVCLKAYPDTNRFSAMVTMPRGTTQIRIRARLQPCR
jgi:hypothetical protein